MQFRAEEKITPLSKVPLKNTLCKEGPTINANPVVYILYG